MDPPDRATRLVIDAVMTGLVTSPDTMSLRLVTELGLTRLSRIVRRFGRLAADEIYDSDTLREMFASKRVEAEAAGDEYAAALLGGVEQHVPELLFDRKVWDSGVARVADDQAGRTRDLVKAALLTFAHATCQHVTDQLLAATWVLYRQGWRRALEKREVRLQEPAQALSEEALDAAIHQLMTKRRGRSLPYWVRLLMDVTGVTVQDRLPHVDEHWLERIQELRVDAVHESPHAAAQVSDAELEEFVMLPTALAVRIAQVLGIDFLAPSHLPYATFSALHRLSKPPMTWEEFCEGWPAMEAVQPLQRYFEPPS